MVYRTSKGKNIKPLQPACRKKIYYSREEALEAIIYITGKRHVRNLHVYHCSICGFWHLTSLED